MGLHERSAQLVQIYDMLYRLGITANYTGFFYTAYAVWLCAQQPDRLLLVTKWVYPEVATYYDTNWKAVERDIRFVITIAWHSNPQMMSVLAGCELQEKPRPARFLSILMRGVFPNDMKSA